MEDRMVVGRYWCYICSQMVNPTMEAEIKCPFCESGFLEETTSTRPYSHNNGGNDSAPITNVSLWAPILLGLIGGFGSSRLRLTGRAETNNANDPTDDELGTEFESVVSRRRRRGSGSGSGIRILQDMRTESESPENGGSDRGGGGRMILFDPFNGEALIVQGSFGFSNGQSSNPRPAISFSDFLVGPGLDLLLQYLSDNDPNRHGSPPAKKEAVQAMPDVTIDDNLPTDDEKIEGNGAGNSGRGGDRAGHRRRYWIPIPWPSEGLITLPGSSSTASLEAMPGSSSGVHTDDN
ncbi:hypothetical protein HRI_002121400 [Hibiscus trionum]|uniref:RING-type E3 ubiquitin transferase n=1 Tax=Hibiscus trionum TaxID=183268 RepID=A0A9W7HWU3_HIBTR|nr:hypothetical protein HRI_002121400 [Hibiscus trionum]